MGTLVGTRPSKFRIPAASAGDAAAALKRCIIDMGAGAKELVYEPEAMHDASGVADVFRAAGFKLALDESGDITGLGLTANKLPCAVMDLAPLLDSFASLVVDGSALKFTEQESVLTFTFRRGRVRMRTRVSVPRSPAPTAHTTRVEFRHNATPTKLAKLAKNPVLEVLEIAVSQGIRDLSPVAALTRLTSLRVIACENIQDVSAVASLSNLENLDLRGTPIRDLSPISGCTKLHELVVTSDAVTDIAALASCRSLVKLDLWTHNVRDLSPLSKLASLAHLRLSCDAATDLSPLAGLASLEKLELSCRSVTDYSPLSNLTSLTSLSISSTTLADSSPFRRLTNLRSLSLHAAMRGTGQLREIEAVANMHALEGLCVANTDVEDLSPICSCHRLSFLDIQSTRVRDISALSNIRTLVHAWLAGTQVTDLTPLEASAASGALWQVRLPKDTPRSAYAKLYGLQPESRKDAGYWLRLDCVDPV